LGGWARHPSTLQRCVAIVLALILAVGSMSAAPPPRTAAVETQPTPASDALAVESDPEPSAQPALPVPISILDQPGGASGALEVSDDVALRQAPESDAVPAVRTELVDQRAEHSRAFAEPDGTVTIESSPARLNFLDGDGDWTPVDLRLVPADGDGPYDLEVAALDSQMRFATEDPADALAEMESDGVRIALRVPDFDVGPDGGSPAPSPSAAPSPPAASASPEPSQPPAPSPSAGPSPSTPGTPAPNPSPLPQPTSSPQPSPSPEPTTSPAPSPSPSQEPEADPETLTFEETSGDRTLRVGGSGAGLNFTMTLADASAPSVHHFALDVGDNVIEHDAETDRLTIVDPDGAFSDGIFQPLDVGVISPPFLIQPDRLHGSPVTVTVTRSDSTELPEGVPAELVNALAPGEVLLSYHIDPDWLTDPARTFPLVLDSTICIGAGASGCDENTNTDNEAFDEFVFNANPDHHDDPNNPWTVNRVGYDSRSNDGGSYGKMRALLYFPSVALEDGAQVMSASVRITVDQVHGGWSGEELRLYRMTRTWAPVETTWNDVHSPTSGFEAPDTPEAIPGGTTGGTQLSIRATDIVREWYTRRGQDWEPNLGFLLRMVNEGSAYGELDFKRWFTATPANAPLLKITYTIPDVEIEFDDDLGEFYSPSTMTKGRTTSLPLRMENTDVNTTLNSSFEGGWKYALGYRWLDADGDWVACPAPGGDCIQNLSQDYLPRETKAETLSVTAPSTVGQYTLVLDLVHEHSTGPLWGSDWAAPSKYYARVKNVLSPESTHWTGSSAIGRAEFGVSVVAGGGTAVGDLRSVALGDGSSIGINVGTRNLHFEGSGGIAFDDLTPLALTYGYDRANVSDCVTITHACGWYTNFDERVIAGDEPGAYTYRDPAGNRHLVGTDDSGQLTGSASVLLTRPRVTMLDERDFDSSTSSIVAVSAASQGIPEYSGANVLKQASNADLTYDVPTVDLSRHRWVSFAAYTTHATGVGLGFKIHNLTDPDEHPDTWFVYVLGSTIEGNDEQFDLNGSVVGNWRTETSLDLYDRLLDEGLADANDRVQVTGFKTFRHSASVAGSTFIDAVRFEGRPSTILDGSFPDWTANEQNAELISFDAVDGGNSIQVSAAGYDDSPQCGTANGCLTSRNLVTNPFVTWSWKKLGGSTIAIAFGLENDRTENTNGITYYAGPTPPEGAPFPIQVSPTLPTEWTTVTRNVLEDGRQVLGYYFDNPLGETPEAPPVPPQADPVRMATYRLVAGDGSFARFDELQIATLPDTGEDQRGHPSTAGDGTFTYDYVATYRGGERHYFNADGFLERIVDTDDNRVELDWTVNPATESPSAWQLSAIRSASDATSGPGVTYQREIEVNVALSSDRRRTAFIERLGTTASSTGRHTRFWVATTDGTSHGSGDLLAVSPARDADHDCPTDAPSRPNGCLEFDYTNNVNHSLDEVRDPRWDGSTSGSDDFRVAVGYADGSPVSISDRSRSSASLLAIISYDVGASGMRRALVADAAAMAAGHASYVDLSPDDKVRTEYVPLSCSGGGCAAGNPGTGNPATPDDDDRLRVFTFDGLADINAEIAFRVGGSDSQRVVSRQGSNAAAKVDNYADALTAADTAWTQSPDQHFASLADSGGDNPDLYRTTYAYDGEHNVIRSSTPVYNRDPDYPAAVQATISIDAYWRMGDAGTTLVNATGNAAYDATASGGVTTGVTGALARDADTAMRFDGVNDVATSSVALHQAAYTIEAWVRQNDDYADDETIVSHGIAGRWASNSGAALYEREGRLHFRHGAEMVDTKQVLKVDRWYHVAATWDGSVARVYLDGVQVGLLDVASAPGSGGSSFEIGRFNGGENEADIDEVVLYRRALAPNRIAAHVQAGRGVMDHKQHTRFDAHNRPIETHDAFVANGGFESALAEWQSGGGALWMNVEGADPNVNSGLGSLALPAGGWADQDAQLVPGQTARFQLAAKASTAGVPAEYDLSYWQASSGSWVALESEALTAATWTEVAWDVHVPLDSDGRVRLHLEHIGSSGTVYFDDVVLVSQWGESVWGATGLQEQVHVLQPGGAAQAVYQHRFAYVANASHPAVFVTSETQNWENGTYTASAPDQDLISLTTRDAWGRALVATDPDGVATTSTYAANMTDLASSADGLGNATTFGYDQVGNTLSVTNPTGEVAATTYDLFSRTETTTAPDGTVSDDVYDNFGRRASSIANATGIADAPTVTTTFAHDAFGRVTDTFADSGGAGVIKAKTTTAYDQLGNVVRTTAYSDGPPYTQARTTTSHFATTEAPNPPRLYSRPAASGTQLPVFPTGSPAPLCPGSSTVRCNTVAALDINGRTVTSTDAYGIATLTDRDAAGNVVQTVANWQPGQSATADRNVTTLANYDIAGRLELSTDAADRETVTEYDAVGRVTRTLTRQGAGETNDYSDVRTVYTAAGRVDRVSDPAAHNADETERTWTKTEYDAAGRAVRTLRHHDIDGNAHLRLDGLETGTDGWSADSTAGFINAGGSMALDTAFHPVGPRNGHGRLRITTSAGTANTGAVWNLSGQTYRQDHTYRLQLAVRGPSGTTLRAMLGTSASQASSTIVASGAWQTLSVDWTPASATASSVFAALRTDAALTADVYLDDAVVWDIADAGWNIPTETAYDAAGRVVASTLPPGNPTKPTMTTTTAYDPAGRTVAVSANAQRSFSHAVAAQGTTSSMVGYWPLDERAGTTAADEHGSLNGTYSGVRRLGQAGAADEARTAAWLDGDSGVVTVADAAALDLAGPLSLAFWARSDVTLDGGTSGGWVGGVERADTYGLGWTSNVSGGGWRFQVKSGATTHTVDATGTSVEAGRWYFVAGTYDGATLKLYIDGELAGSNAIGSVGIDNTASALTIGQVGSGNWGGALDEVGLWADDLSATQVGDLYAAARRSSAEIALTTRTTYDALGRSISTTSPRGIQTRYEHDRLGRVLATVANARDGSAASATSDDDVRSEFAYNAVGELVGHCSAKQVHVGDCAASNASEEQAWRYSYDAMGRQVSQTPPVNTSATALVMREWSYQPGGRLGSIVDRVAGGGTVQRHTDFSHDSLGRVTGETVYLGSGTSNPELTWITTWNDDGTRASRDFDGDDADPQQADDAWDFSYDDLGRPNEVKQGSTTITDYAWNPSGTLASRADLGISGTTVFEYDWAGRQIAVTAPTTFGGGSITFGYGLDGLLASRSTPNGVTATLAYDAAKRPLEVDFSGDTLSRGYDRDGNVTAEGRSLTGVAGDAGSGTATYTYDGLGRVTEMDGLARDDTFSYDRNSNRLTKTEGSTTTTYTYDRSDQLIGQTIGSTFTAFAYNAYGDMTSSADAFDDSTAHTYDAGGRLVSLTPPGEAESEFAYDALGRVSSRETGSATLAYRYLGTGHLSYATDASSGPDTVSLIDATSGRLALDTGGTTAWTLFDLHGNLAGAIAESSATIVSALRYDAWGQLLDDFTAGLGATDTPWRFQGRLNVSPDPDEALYDFGARMYRPSAGVFTQLDTYAGGAVNPLSMNRFLYAHANPVTLIDPDGHCVRIDGNKCLPTQGGVAKPKPTPANRGQAGGPPLLPEDQAAVEGRGPSKSRPADTPQTPLCAATLDCTINSIDSWTASQRTAFVEIVEAVYGQTYQFTGYFNNIKGILDFAQEYGLVQADGWFSMVDAYILHAIQQGLAIQEGQLVSRSGTAAWAWAEFFSEAQDGATHDRLRELWGRAEQAATNLGVSRADGMGRQAASAERSVLIGFGNLYRMAVANPDETRQLIGLAGGSSGAATGGAVGFACGPFAPVCVPSGVIIGAGSGYLISTEIADHVTDPRQRAPASNISAWLYGWFGGEDFAP
jgi:RHS repeat-associated protein